MSYRIEGNEIVISGWEDGISDNPYKGINDMRGVNIVSTPGEASVSFASTSITFASLTGTITSADSGTNRLTGTSTGIVVAGMAVVFSGLSVETDLKNGTIYWVKSVVTPGPGATVFTVSASVGGGGTVVTITVTCTATWATVNMGEITYFDKTSGACIDKNGRAWARPGTSGTYVYLGNTTIANGVGNGIFYYRGYLFVCRNNAIDYTAFVLNGALTAISWVYAWQTLNYGSSVENPHDSLFSRNKNGIFITDGSYICSLLPVLDTGTGYYKTFDPNTAATYNWSLKALVIPLEDTATCLEELGGWLLIGGQLNCIYPWDKSSNGYSDVFKIADNYSYHMITVNTNTYIFAGKRGRIYVTNGTQAELYKKIPDHISGGPDPVFTWYNCAYYKNQIYFGVSATDNIGTALTKYNGVWAIDITTTALRVPFFASTTAATMTAIYADAANNQGFSLITAWKSGTTYGIDTSGYNPYYSYESYIETDVLPVGEFLKKKTFQNLEFKLTCPLKWYSAGVYESIKISVRSSKFGTYTQIGETLATATDSPISDVYLTNFDQLQWVQFKIEMSSINNANVSAPSYVRLYELRLRP